MLGVAQESISTMGHSSVAIGTGIGLATPDHTTQICSIVMQVISLLILWLNSRKKQENV